MKPAAKKRIVVSVTNDLVSDNRVHKVCSTLTGMGFSVLLVGRKLPGSLNPGKRNYATGRFWLPFIRGPLFYAFYNLRLFLFLLFRKCDLLLSNDLDTLPANFLAARIRKKPLIYDSHEFFTEVPELVHRPQVKRIWEWMEARMVPHVTAAFTVCNSIARIYTEKYGVPFRVVRNFPLASADQQPADTELRNIGAGSKFILYQGAVNAGRGLEQVIEAMKFVNDLRLVIAGGGDKRMELEKLVKEKGLSDKVEFLGRLPIEKLGEITPIAAVGLSVEQDIGLNYHYALPNKLFDYIKAQVPVLVTNLPEMESIVRQHEIGEVISDMNPQKLAAVLTDMTVNSEKRRLWKKNLKKASQEFIWEKEETILRQIFVPFL